MHGKREHPVDRFGGIADEDTSGIVDDSEEDKIDTEILDASIPLKFDDIEENDQSDEKKGVPQTGGDNAGIED